MGSPGRADGLPVTVTVTVLNPLPSEARARGGSGWGHGSVETLSRRQGREALGATPQGCPAAPRPWPKGEASAHRRR